MKNYIGYVNDHSGSMETIRKAAAADYNANILAVKDAATREMLNTVVSVVGVGFPSGSEVTRQLVISNPHVLKEITDWQTKGATPLYDGIGNIIELHESLPDYNDPSVSFLIIITTDGEEYLSRTKWSNREVLRSKIEALQRTGRWTFVGRVPRGATHKMTILGIPAGNITEWDTTEAGMRASTVQTTAAVNSYMSARSAGSKSTNVFYTTAAAVDTSKLTDVSNQVKLYVVPMNEDGSEIKDFILKRRMAYLIGAGFYQLTKVEARVTPDKLLLIRDRTTGAVYAGDEARKMVGIDTVNNARVKPDHGGGKYDIFIQSESTNRKLVGGTGLLYWEAKGRPMTADDLNKYKLPKASGTPVPVAPPVVQLPQAPSTRQQPTQQAYIAVKSPTSTLYGGQVNGKAVAWFKEREAARAFHRANNTVTSARDGLKEGVQGPNGERWFVYL